MKPLTTRQQNILNIMVHEYQDRVFEKNDNLLLFDIFCTARDIYNDHAGEQEPEKDEEIFSFLHEIALRIKKFDQHLQTTARNDFKEIDLQHQSFFEAYGILKFALKSAKHLKNISPDCICEFHKA